MRGSARDFEPPRFKSGTGQSTFLYTVVVWNKLPAEIKAVFASLRFKHSCKAWLMLR
jgi:hypothetical protein